jgi:hypothetical protein
MVGSRWPRRTVTAFGIGGTGSDGGWFDPCPARGRASCPGGQPPRPKHPSSERQDRHARCRGRRSSGPLRPGIRRTEDWHQQGRDDSASQDRTPCGGESKDQAMQTFKSIIVVARPPHCASNYRASAARSTLVRHLASMRPGPLTSPLACDLMQHDPSLRAFGGCAGAIGDDAAGKCFIVGVPGGQRAAGAVVAWKPPPLGRS